MRPSVLAVAALLLWCCSTAVHAALSFHLNSLDFLQPVDTELLLKNYVAQNPGNAVCVLVALDNGLGGVARFTYASNVTNVGQHAHVLVSIHSPLPSAPSVAVLDAVENVIDTKVFPVNELHNMNVEASFAQRNKKRQGEKGVVEEEEEMEEIAHSSTVTLRPVLTGTGTSAHALDGNYAACFRLLPPFGTVLKGAPPVPEDVHIRLLEVASTRRSTSTYIARLSKLSTSGQAVNIGTSEADREYAKMIRRLFRANKNADLQELLDTNEVVSSQQMRQELDLLKAVQQQLFSLYSSSERLEERYARMRATAETTFTRIWVCMIFTVAVMAATIWLTFHFTKDIVIKRKMI